MSEVQQLKKCARCHCNILLETYFSKNRKGQYNQTCDRCRVRCKCPHCEYTCSSNADLQKHVKRIHNKIKDFQCPHCDHKCSENGNLQAHIKQIHTKIKDFECGLCNYKCSTNGHLHQHIKAVHSKIKDVKCPTCEYKCSTNSDLQRHIKAVHTKIKDFECLTCVYNCSKNSDLQRHIKICVGNEQGSSGEVKIKKVLNEMKIDYQYNSSHEVKNENNNYLRWDFIITSCEEPLFIEYDGRQHFEPVEHWGGQKAFEQTKKYDKLKDDYCNDNGYLLLRIPYTEYGNIPQLITDFICENTNWGYE
jgi:very-short-patch-repair endonuclease